MSVLNSRGPATLVQGSTFTGTFENCRDALQIAIVVSATSTNNIGLLRIEFSRDASTITSTCRMPILDADLNKVIVCKVTDTYYRVKFTAVDIYDTRSVTQANTYTALAITTQLRKRPGYKDVNISEQPILFRCQNSITDTTKVLGAGLTLNTLSTFPQSAASSYLRVTNTSGSNNDETGTAARTFLVTGVNTSLDEIYWIGGMVGSGTSTTSPQVFFAVNDFILLTFGSTGCAQAGSTISLQIFNGSWTTLGQLTSSTNYTYYGGLYTVPNGYSVTPTSACVSTTSRSATSARLSVLSCQTRAPQQSVVLNMQNSPQIIDSISASATGSMFVLEGTSTGTNTICATICMNRGQPSITTLPTIYAPNSTFTTSGLTVVSTYTEDSNAFLMSSVTITAAVMLPLFATVTLTSSSDGILRTSYYSGGVDTYGTASATYSAGTWSATSSNDSDMTALLRALMFQPTANTNNSVTINVSIGDAVTSALASGTLTCIAVDDAPTATNLTTTQNYTINTTLTLTAIVVTDVDDTNTTVTMQMSTAAAGSLSTPSSGGTSSSFNAGTGLWSVSGPVAKVNTILQSVVFTPTTDYVTTFTITNTVTDSANASVTGTATLCVTIPSSQYIYFSSKNPAGNGSLPSNGTTFSSWTDLSGNSRNFTNVVGTSPTFVTNTFGSSPAVSFSGGPCALQTSTSDYTPYDSSIATTFVLYFKLNSGNLNIDQFILASKSNNAGRYQDIRYNGSGSTALIQQYNGNSNGVSSGMWYAISKTVGPHIVIFRQSHTTATMRIDGATVTCQGTLLGGGSNGTTNLADEGHLFGSIGCIGGGAGSSSVLIGLVAVYSRALTDNECKQLEGFVANTFI